MIDFLGTTSSEKLYAAGRPHAHASRPLGTRLTRTSSAVTYIFECRFGIETTQGSEHEHSLLRQTLAGGGIEPPT